MTNVTPTVILKGETTLSAELHRLKNLVPDFYREFFNRFYEQEHLFHDWRLPLYYNMVSLIQAKKNLVVQGTLTDNFLLESQIAIKMHAHQNPLYFVHPELLQACMASSAAKDLSIEQLGLPHEAFSFVLPRGIMRKGVNEVCFISVARDPKGHHPVNFELESYKIGLDLEAGDTAILITTYFPWTSESWTFRLNDDYINRLEDVPLREHFRDMSGKIIPRKFTPSDDEFTHTILSTVMNLICAMRVRPDLVTRERRIKQVRRDRKKELWAPNILGKTYRIVIQGGVEKGEHASPRMHWRRGHFRQQGHGPRNLCATEGCLHRLGHHAQATDSEGRLDWPTGCLQPNCKCSAYTRPARPYLTYETTWLEPMLVAASKEGNGTSKTTMA